MGGDQVVSIRTFYYADPSLNPDTFTRNVRFEYG